MEHQKPLTECLTYKIFYYIEDETIAVKELKKNIQGHDYCPYLLRRTKIRKNFKRQVNCLVAPESDDDSAAQDDFLKPSDFLVGNEVIVLGHRFLLCDCDVRTRCYYESVLKTPQGEKITIEKVKTAKIRTVFSVMFEKTR